MLDKYNMLKLLATGGIKIDNGKLIVMQIPFVFMPAEVWATFFNVMTKEKGLKESERFQYVAAKEAGKQFPKLFKGMGDDFTLYEYIKKYGGFSGWGKFEVMVTDELGKNQIHSVVKCQNPTLPECLVPSLNSKRPVCYSQLAIVAGVVEGVFGKNHDGLETDCYGCGHEYCVYEIAPMSYLKKKYPKRVKEQFHWMSG